MKNVTRLPRIEVFREPILGVLASSKWAIKYVSGIDDGGAETKAGDWLVKWEMSPERILFAFCSEGNLYFLDEASAQAVSNMLRKQMEIETEVVKVG